jgi:hypothetical protein
LEVCSPWARGAAVRRGRRAVENFIVDVEVSEHSQRRLRGDRR